MTNRINRDKLGRNSWYRDSQSISADAEVATNLKDDEYWLKGDMMVFKAGNILFRVPTYLLSKNSEFFAAMFELPQGQNNRGSNEEGKSEENPIILPETITTEDFRNFLRAIYPQTIHKTIISGLVDKSELLSILKLSTMWEFLDYRAEAIKQLRTMQHLFTPIEKIDIGRTYKISAFLKEGYSTIVTRQEQINDGEAICIGIFEALALFRIRETFRSQRRDLDGLISGCFETELKDIKAEEEHYTVSTGYTFPRSGVF
ncbi:hypothetical protein BDN70DRAFT_860714 [Pholiota conissans]|uniref:BTB domain-containing protein n=1 Tax=Pholiota conissans TaxID=109636 RepID=A0A9P5Z0Z1_9AGAR|nr:hypothetical protein BDN70DRAFT_860714 [Pholiota conissans]